MQQVPAEFRRLDALRAIAMLLGVVLHTLIPYMGHPIEHLLWPVRDGAGGIAADGAYWWIHGFRVPLFFVVAGLLAAMAIDRHGPAVFLERRLKRIGLPLAAGIVLVLPVMYFVWAWGWVESGLAEPMHILHIRFGHGMQKDLYGLAHLWFLEYLLLYSGVLYVWHTLVRAPGGKLLEPLIASNWRAVVLAVPTALLLFLDPRPLSEFYNWFWPRGSEFLYHGWFFVVGVAMAGWRETLVQRTRRWPLDLLCSMPAFIAMWVLHNEGSAPARLMWACAAGAFAWFSIFAWLGCFLNAWRDALPGRPSIARPAYWVYVIHPPIVGALQIALLRLPLPWWSKAASIAAVTVAVCVWSYWYLWTPAWEWAHRWGNRPNWSEVSRRLSSTSPATRA